MVNRFALGAVDNLVHLVKTESDLRSKRSISLFILSGLRKMFDFQQNSPEGNEKIQQFMHQNTLSTPFTFRTDLKYLKNCEEVSLLNKLAWHPSIRFYPKTSMSTQR